jgi:hypothetical protein
MSSISESTKSSWMDVTNESVHTSDDVDIGDIEAINRNFIVIKRGFVNVHHYYVPMTKVEGWDGHVVWLKITEEDVKTNYERDRAPDPAIYYLQDYPYGKVRPFTRAYFPKMPIIETKSKTRAMPSITSTQKTREEALGAEQPRRYSCVLCDTGFNTEDDLSNHVIANH